MAEIELPDPTSDEFAAALRLGDQLAAARLPNGDLVLISTANLQPTSFWLPVLHGWAAGDGVIIGGGPETKDMRAAVSAIGDIKRMVKFRRTAA